MLWDIYQSHWEWNRSRAFIKFEVDGNFQRLLFKTWTNKCTVSSWFEILMILDLSLNNMGDGVATALSQGHFPNLTSLDLYRNQIGAAGATSLSKANFQNLMVLILYENRMGAPVATTLSQANYIKFIW